MSEKSRRLGWWPVGLIALGFGIFVFLEGRAHLTTATRMIAQLAGLLLIYALLFSWFHVNQGALLNESCEELAQHLVSSTKPEPEPDQIVGTDAMPDDVPGLPPEFTCHK